jgi:hypothetical protein
MQPSPVLQRSPSAPAGLRPRMPSPPPAVAYAAADAAAAAGEDSSPLTQQSPAAPGRFIPAAALMGVSRTMVYVRMPGPKQVGACEDFNMLWCRVVKADLLILFWPNTNAHSGDAAANIPVTATHC